MRKIEGKLVKLKKNMKKLIRIPKKDDVFKEHDGTKKIWVLAPELEGTKYPGLYGSVRTVQWPEKRKYRKDSVGLVLEKIDWYGDDLYKIFCEEDVIFVHPTDVSILRRNTK